MTWAHHHSSSEGLASAAEVAVKRGDLVEARKLYLSAAEAEQRALEELDVRKSRTLGITVVSTVALYYKAHALSIARAIAEEWRNHDLLPAFAASQLDEICEKIVQDTGELADTSASSMKFDLVCFSHHRWDSVYKESDNLFSHVAKERRVFFFEEAVFEEGTPMRLDVEEKPDGVKVVIPRLPAGLRSEIALVAVLKEMTRQLFISEDIRLYVAWYDTAEALRFTTYLDPLSTVYEIQEHIPSDTSSYVHLERELMHRADVVLTSDRSNYEAKQGLHPIIRLFPKGIHLTSTVASTWLQICDLLHTEAQKMPKHDWATSSTASPEENITFSINYIA